jgi:hypothetical protein
MRVLRALTLDNYSCPIAQYFCNTLHDLSSIVANLHE